jgi:hypothetical protein
MSMDKRNDTLVKTNVDKVIGRTQTRRYMGFEQVPMGRCLAALFIKRAVYD